MEPTTRELTQISLNHFERLVRPLKIYFLTAHHVDHYVAQRRQERGRRRARP
jgi:hypothetical protein